MDTKLKSSAFERLKFQLQGAADPYPIIERFESELLQRYPGDATEIIELISHWMHRLGIINSQQLRGYV